MTQETRKVEEFCLQNGDGPDYKFRGYHLGSISGMMDYKLVTMSLYKTVSGNYICYRCDEPQLERSIGEYDYKTKVTYFHDNEDLVHKTFGYGPMAKKLYRECGIDCFIEIPDREEKTERPMLHFPISRVWDE